MGSLEGQIAIVTGAAEGPKAALGAHIALALAAEGAAVVAADISDCGSVVAKIEAGGGTALAFKADVTREEDVAMLVGATIKEFGAPTILINNAAYGSNIPPVSIRDLSVDDWDKALAVNLRGPFLCSREVSPHMEQRGWGKIINVGSATAIEGLPSRLHYVTSKGGVHAMTRALARELGPSGIRVNAVAPGLVMNESVASIMVGREQVLDHVRQSRAIPHDVVPDDLIGVIVLLASPASDAITGQTFIVDNGGVFL